LGFLDKLRSLLGPGEDKRAYWLYVQCDRCDERIKTRVDLFNDLSVRYREKGRELDYYCRKVIIGSNRCFQPIEVQLSFDSKRNLIEREILNGVFISAEEYRNTNEG